ncbi:MAG TPA: hypothetical protein VFW19_03390 [Allosphingosinicella sp.]|nr:hypothetical protein [Allosphingosinicella sp.]
MRPPEPSRRPLLAVGALVFAGAAGAWLLLRRAAPRDEPKPAAAARALGAGAAVLAFSVATDSALEHYRGSFENKAMFIAPAVSTITIAAAALTLLRPGTGRTAKGLVFAAATATGAAGVGFHVYDIAKREGGFDLNNLFYHAPLGAPAAIGLAGIFGLLSQRFARGETGLLGNDGARLIAPFAAAALLGTVAEAGLLHFRGSFQNPAMYAPVTLPPAAAAALAASAAAPRLIPAARFLLEGTAMLGIAGPVFHAYGIHRNMGGWRNWSQMILQGPPLPAPPAFLGIAIVGLAMLPLLEEDA